MYTAITMFFMLGAGGVAIHRKRHNQQKEYRLKKAAF